VAAAAVQPATTPGKAVAPEERDDGRSTFIPRNAAGAPHATATAADATDTCREMDSVRLRAASSAAPNAARADSRFSPVSFREPSTECS